MTYIMGETTMAGTTTGAAQAFLLITPRRSSFEFLSELCQHEIIHWARPAYGPYPVIAYAMADSGVALTRFAERLRSREDVAGLDVRVCKFIPGDEELKPPVMTGPETAVLLINVNYSLERERDVTYKLRKFRQIKLARAMWGPADIVVIVEESDHESMRNLICDEIKVLKGVASNTTLYCYPDDRR
jgi:hypothetical protein